MLTLLSVFVTACSSTSRYEILSFFFDGVPNPHEKHKAVDSLVVDSAYTTVVKKTAPVQEFFYHPPYQERSCDDCHQNKFGNSLVEKVPDLCFECHDDIREDYVMLHGPVAGGYCTACHSPHLAKNDKLLKFAGSKLCLNCHSIDDISQNKTHVAIDEYICQDCHNAHGGNDKYFLN